MSDGKMLHELSVAEIRARLGREPTIGEWVALTRAAAAARDFSEQMEKVRAIAAAEPLPPNPRSAEQP